MMKVSECCGAGADGSIEDGIGICSDCKEWADFDAEKESKVKKND